MSVFVGTISNQFLENYEICLKNNIFGVGANSNVGVSSASNVKKGDKLVFWISGIGYKSIATFTGPAKRVFSQDETPWDGTYEFTIPFKLDKEFDDVYKPKFKDSFQIDTGIPLPFLQSGFAELNEEQANALLQKLDLAEDYLTSKDFSGTTAKKLASMKSVFTSYSQDITHLISDMDSGRLAIPDIQRDYVWDTTKVRDLFDSLYKGYPIGYIMLWDVTNTDESRSIGVNEKNLEAQSHIIDGQQRLTSLYSVIKKAKVINADDKEVNIELSFRPYDEKFEVSNAATKINPEYFSDISGLFDNTQTYKLVKEFIENLKKHRKVNDEEENHIEQSLMRVAGLLSHDLQVVKLISEINNTTAADIFVRINSQGTVLTQTDFIMTILSVNWQEGKRESSDFCSETRTPPEDNKLSAYNHLIKLSPGLLVRTISMLAFNRAVLRNVYPLLAGSDSSSDEYLEMWKVAHNKVLNRENWQSFINIVNSAGFVLSNTVNQANSFMYVYGFYLIGLEHNIDKDTLRRIISSYFFMTTLSRRYAGSGESKCEQDLKLIDSDGKNFVSVLEEIMSVELTEDFWNIRLPNQLVNSRVSMSRAYDCYTASNIILGSKTLFSSHKLINLADTQRRGVRKMIELHHLFPKDVLKKQNKVTKDINQVANLAHVEWKDNADISNSHPKEYLIDQIKRFKNKEVEEMFSDNALWVGWEDTDYDEFLDKRRKLISNIIKKGWQLISEGKIKVNENIPSDLKITTTPQEYTTEDLVINLKVETSNLELKESFLWDVNLDEVNNDRLFDSAKAIAGFLNTQGGTLFVGISDSLEIVGLERDINSTKGKSLDDLQLIVVDKLKKIIPGIDMTKIRLAFQEFNNLSICRIDVWPSDNAVFTERTKNSQKVKEFYVREPGATKPYKDEEQASYILTRFS